jgi:hypothetical protein
VRAGFPEVSEDDEAGVDAKRLQIRYLRDFGNDSLVNTSDGNWDGRRVPVHFDSSKLRTMRQSTIVKQLR